MRSINTVRSAAFVALAVLPAAVALAAAPPAPTTSNGTIYWSSQSFYQVQRTTAQNGQPVDYNLCDSNRNGQSCAVPAGKYVVNAQGGNPWAKIAEWPLTVTAATAPAGTSAPVKPTVANGRISWTTGFFYQVQRTTVQNGLPVDYDLCNSNGGLSCAVPAGTYVVNAQGGTPYRKLAEWTIVVPGSSTGPTTPPASAGCGPASWTFQAAPGFNSPTISGKGQCMPGGGIGHRSWATPGLQSMGTVQLGPVGTNFSIDWQNFGPTDARQHKEFDISVARDINSAGLFAPSGGPNLGYGRVTVGELAARSPAPTMTARAKWDTAPIGKTHVQSLIWLTRVADKDNNYPDTFNSAGQPVCSTDVNRRGSVDITVAEWMSPVMRTNYLAYKNDNPGATPTVPSNTTRVGTFTVGDGSTYHAFRRPGGICEVASYIVIREQQRNFTATNGDVSVVKPGEIVKKLLGLERGRGASPLPFDESWVVSVLGWEVAGATKEFNYNSSNPNTLGDSSGKINFRCYSIPRINDGTSSGPGFDACS